MTMFDFHHNYGKIKISMKNKALHILSLVLLAIGGFSCSDTLEVETKGVLDPSQHYRDIYDANAAVLGV